MLWVLFTRWLISQTSALKNKEDMNHKLQSDIYFFQRSMKARFYSTDRKMMRPQMKAIWSQCHPSPTHAILFPVFDITKCIFLWISSTNIHSSFLLPSALSYFLTFHYGNTPTALYNILIPTCTVPFLLRLRTV
jgi:hypothetical protein